MNWGRIWANRLIGGTQVWDDVPEARRRDVTEELSSRVAAGEIPETRMNEILGT